MDNKRIFSMENQLKNKAQKKESHHEKNVYTIFANPELHLGWLAEFAFLSLASNPPLSNQPPLKYYCFRCS